MMDHRRRPRIRSILFVIPVVLFIGFSVWKLVDLALEFRLGTGEQTFSSDNIRQHHAVLILPGEGRRFYEPLISSFLSQTAILNELSLGLQYMEPFPFMGSSEALYRQTEIALIAGVDGVIIASTRDSNLGPLLSAARERGLAVVSINSPYPEEALDSLLSIDSFDLGVELGEKLRSDEVRLTAVDVISNGEAIISRLDDFARGLRTALFARNLPHSVSLYPLESGDVFARQTIDGILNSAAPGTVIISDSPDITLNLAQAVVESNLVGRLSIAGTGSPEELQDYIDAGIIRLLMSVSFDEIAIKALGALGEKLNDRSPERNIPVSFLVFEPGRPGEAP